MKPLIENQVRYIGEVDDGFRSETKAAIDYLLKILTSELKPTGRKQTTVHTFRVCSQIAITSQSMAGRDLYELFYNSSRSMVKSLREKLEDCSSVDHIEISYQEDASNPWGGGRVVVLVEATKSSWLPVLSASSGPSAPNPTPEIRFVATAERDL